MRNLLKTCLIVGANIANLSDPKKYCLIFFKNQFCGYSFSYQLEANF